MDAYVQGLMISSLGTSVVMQRKPAESWINTDVMRVWLANMCIQFILDPYVCHIHSFIHVQTERSMSELLKQVSKESSGQEIWKQLRLLASVFLNHREVSAQENVYRILSLPLKQLSRVVIFINTDSKQERLSILKNANQIQQMEDNEERIFQTSLIDRYADQVPSMTCV